MSSTKALLEAQDRKYEILLEKWEPIIENPALGDVPTSYEKRRDLAVVLENQNEYNETLLKEAAPNNNTTGISNWDPVLIGLVRRSLPKLIGYELFGVQPMSGPTGLAFALKSRYGAQNGTEAGFNTVNSAYSGTGTDNAYDPFSLDSASPPAADYGSGTGMATSTAEALGTTGSTDFNEMSFSIEKVTVEAKSRGLRAKYSHEMAQDLKRMHGLDAQQELANILSTEILQEQNRELLVMVNKAAVLGCASGTTTAGTFDVTADSDGRWSQERWSGLRFRMNIESGAIARGTRRGRGNWIITTHDVAAALAEAGRLLPGTSTNPVKLAGVSEIDESNDAFAGVLDGRYKVYIDTLFSADGGADYHYATVGYKGANRYDAGMFYCPYVPIEMYQAVGENSFIPRIGFKTRYGVVANPLPNASAVSNSNGYARDNQYFRIFKITNLV